MSKFFFTLNNEPSARKLTPAYFLHDFSRKCPFKKILRPKFNAKTIRNGQKCFSQRGRLCKYYSTFCYKVTFEKINKRIEMFSRFPFLLGLVTRWTRKMFRVERKREKYYFRFFFIRNCDLHENNSNWIVFTFFLE